MNDHRQCTICGRVGVKAFTKMGDAWVCTASRTCWNRRHAEHAELRRSIALLRDRTEPKP